MTAAMMRRLHSLVGDLSLHSDGVWQFNRKLATKDVQFFRHLIRQHQLLNIEYSVFCSHLAHNFLRDPDSEQLTEEIAAALALSELLSYIYQHYLSVPREVQRLRKDQKIYRQLLRERGYQFRRKDEEEPKNSFSPSQKIRNLTVTINFPRQLAVRMKRFLDAIAPIIKQVERYGQFVFIMDKFANPAIAYLAWIFFIPRLSINIFLLFKHLIPGFWMSEKEAKLEWFVRLEVQLQRRWFELGNDTAWLIVGVLSCFLLASPAAMYLTLGLYMFDIILAVSRATLEINRLKKLQDEYALLVENASPEELLEIERLQYHLQRRIRYEQMRVAVVVFNTSALFLAVCLTLPFIAVNPFIPLIGTFLLVAITLITYLANRWVEKQKPSDNISCLIEEKTPALGSSQSFFYTQNKSRQKMEDSESENDFELEENIVYYP